MHYKVGDDVTVKFKGQQVAGEVIDIYRSSGFILCRIHIDPTWDYGQVEEDLDPEPYVCVRENQVKANAQ